MKLSKSCLRKLILNELKALTRESVLNENEHQNPQSYDERAPDDITSHDMADAKRYAGDDPVAQAKHLGISIEDWHKVRQEIDDGYEERHVFDQLEADDGWYDLPELSPSLPADHPSLATGPEALGCGSDLDQDLTGDTNSEKHPLDDDGDGNVDWDEISENKTLDFERFAFGQAKTAQQPSVETGKGLTETHGSLIRSRYYGRY